LVRSAPIFSAGALLAVALVGGCVDGVYHCASDTQCVNAEGDTGSCVTGYCAYADTTCGSGRRYGEGAGELAGQCTEGPADAARDGAADATPGDGASAIDAPDCVPGASEICNGFDDDCDDMADEDFELGAACDGADADLCQEGVIVCTANGLATECGDVTPDNAELCNGADDDCDGATDEGFDVGIDCDGLDGDDCLEGTVMCNVAGTGTICDDTTGTLVESCNGLDDDCDGTADEGFGLGTACDGLDLDFCNEGIIVCDGAGGTTCNDATATNVESCDGDDDNCNGVIDEGFALMIACDGDDLDLCPEGVTVCNGSGNGTTCNDTTPTNVEVCNGVDDNCNALIDEGFGVGTSCDGGDTDACLEGMIQCNGAGGTMCSDATSSTTETCNGLDDDCRNGADDPWPLKGTSCAAGVGACRRTGMYVCNTAGSDIECNAIQGTAGREFCGDGIDSDCLGDTDPACPVNDLRTSPTIISASGTFAADVRFANDNVAPTCQTATGGRDVFYQFTLSTAQIVYVDTFGSNYDTVLRLENGTCSANAAQSQCVNNSCSGTLSQLAVSLTAGTYCLAVDQASSSVTAGTLAMSFVFGGRTGTPLATGTGLTVSGNTCGSTNVTNPACATSTAPDVAYWFTLCPSTSRTLAAETCNAATSWDTMLSARQSSGVTGGELACNDDMGGACPSNQVASEISLALSGPGLFWMIVDGFSTSCGAYTVDYSL
jgi:hypothetical protein